MATSPVQKAIEHFRRAALRSDGGGLSDGELLETFLSQREEAAFEALVRRHGPMVLGVCLRVLRNPHDADDAFQATFLVLVRKAASIVPRDLVGNWLYGVAYRTALSAKAALCRRRAKEKQMQELPQAPVEPQEPGHEWQPLVDQELSRLPDKYRLPVVLCDLEGRTRREVARQLNLPDGTLSNRLAAARRLLAKRLARYGLAVSAVALPSLLSPSAALAAVPTSLVVATVQGAARVAAGQAVTGGMISVQVATLTEGVLRAMMLTKLKIALVVLLVAGALSGGGVVLIRPVLAPGQAQASSDGTPKSTRKAPEQPQVTLTWKQQLALQPHVDKGDQIFCAALSPDGKIVATGQTKGLKLLDAVTGQELKTLAEDLMFAVAFAPDGKTLATGRLAKRRANEPTPNTVVVWDVSSGQALLHLQGHGINIYSVAYSPDGKTVASASDTIRLWDPTTGQEIRQFPSSDPRLRGVACIAFSPDGKSLASAECDARKIKLWDVATGKERAAFEGHTVAPVAVAFSPDGKTVASGGHEEVKLWDVATGKERATLKGRPPRGHSLAFSPDSKILACAGGEDNYVKLWDVAMGNEVMTLTEHTSQVWTVAFSRDGKTMVTAGDDAVRVWQATP